MQETVQYILSFLLGSEPLNSADELASVTSNNLASSPNRQYIGYTANQNEWHRYKVVIVPSTFWEKHANKSVSMPQLPLNQLDNMPILFGTPTVKQVGGTLVIYADLVASAFFILSRYEETLNSERDAHGRFQAVSSLAYRAGFLHRPLVDEYGAYLRKCLKQTGVELPCPVNSMQVTLTHDVDVPFEHRTFRSFLGGLYRKQLGLTLKNAFSPLAKNSAYTFPWLLEQDTKLPFAQQLYFLRMPLQKCTLDKPYLNYRSKDMQSLIHLLQRHSVTCGLHVSYLAGNKTSIILAEKKQLEKHLKQPITSSRHHYLRTCHVTDMEALQQVGIMHDYTLGFADSLGFRLGTTRPVKYLSPYTLQVGSIFLHPLLAMDTTLFHYMNLSFQQAFEQLTYYIQTVKKYGGECVLLWHNTTLGQGIAHKKFYKKILQQLQQTFG